MSPLACDPTRRSSHSKVVTRRWNRNTQHNKWTEPRGLVTRQGLSNKAWGSVMCTTASFAVTSGHRGDLIRAQLRVVLIAQEVTPCHVSRDEGANES
jgi:hypothetical protein